MNATFFASIRTSVFDGSMTQSQVDGVSRLLDAWKRLGDGDDFKLAYVLATAKWETNHTMQPVVENLNYTSARRIREVWPSRFSTAGEAMPYVRAPAKLANRVYANRNGNGNEASGDGYRFRGRGDVQTTGRANYEKAGKKLGIDLVSNPDMASDPAISAAILVRGMLEGWFTTKKLSDYINKSTQDFTKARAIVNGSDHASDIAKIATAFFRAIEAARQFGETQYTHSEPATDHVPDAGKKVEPISEGSPSNAKGIGAILASIIVVAIGGMVETTTGWLSGIWNFITGLLQ